jgi:hypothetical protein
MKSIQTRSQLHGALRAPSIACRGGSSRILDVTPPSIEGLTLQWWI